MPAPSPDPLTELAATRVVGLTRDNVAAIAEVFTWEVARGEVELTATTATFKGTPRAALELVAGRMDTLPTRGHPRASLHAVVRKLRKAGA